MLHNRSITHSKISFSCHSYKEAILNNSRNHVQSHFNFFPIQDTIKFPIQKEVAIVSHNWTLIDSNNN